MLGIDIFDAGMLAGISVALGAGFVSFISPCVLPIVPAYLAYISGMSFQEFTSGRRRRTSVLLAVSFVLGLSVVFILLGAAASAFGAYFLTNQVLFSRIAGGVIIVFGWHFLGILPIPFLLRELRLNTQITQGGTIVGAFVLGLAFAFGWTPCIGPILGAVLSFVAQEGSVGRGSIYLISYATGLGLPFIIAAAFIDRSMRYMNRMKPWMLVIERSIGILLILVGLMLITGWFVSVSYWLLETVPVLGEVG